MKKYTIRNLKSFIRENKYKLYIRYYETWNDDWESTYKHWKAAETCKKCMERKCDNSGHFGLNRFMSGSGSPLVEKYRDADFDGFKTSFSYGLILITAVKINTGGDWWLDGNR